MESKIKQLIQNFCDLSKAYHERVRNNTMTKAELVAISKKFDQCHSDVMAIIGEEEEPSQEHNISLTEAEIDAISEKLLQCCTDVKAITVRPVEGEGPSDKPSKAAGKP